MFRSKRNMYIFPSVLVYPSSSLYDELSESIPKREIIEPYWWVESFRFHLNSRLYNIWRYDILFFKNYLYTTNEGGNSFILKCESFQYLISRNISSFRKKQYKKLFWGYKMIHILHIGLEVNLYIVAYILDF